MTATTATVSQAAQDAANQSVLVKIPGATASSSKMSKKGWKCWAKIVTAVASPANDGYAFSGEFVSTGTTIEARTGDVLLHVDQSDSAGIAIIAKNRIGEGTIRWIATASSDGRAWCATLGREARELLAMSRAERLAVAAADVLDDTGRAKPLTPEAVAYWSAIAGRDVAPAADPSPASEPTTPPDAATVAYDSIVAILATLSADERAAVVARIAAVQ